MTPSAGHKIKKNIYDKVCAIETNRTDCVPF